MKIIEFTNEKKYIKDFFSLPKKLYNKTDNMENSNEVKEFLLGKHILCKYFDLYKYLIYKDNEVVGRFCLTEYENDNNIYLGFFECINNKEVSSYLFSEAKKIAKSKNKEKIIGPVDASFWNKYRLKINKFDVLPYTGEPYNKDYYFDLFKNSNWKVIEHYTSNVYQTISEDYENSKFIEHFEEFKKAGYKIESPKLDDYEKVIKEVYKLLTDLYSHFPIYKNIEENDFCEIFKSYKKVINVEMIKMAYFKDELVGFLISFPNYNNLVYHTSNISNLKKILNIKKTPKEYVIPYLGASKEHKGLGKALVWSVAQELKENKLPCISALIRDGNINQKYADELIDNVYEYVLLECDLSEY